jgi:predicted metal-dependent hydrolase
MDVPSPEIVALPTGAARVEWRRSARARRISLRIDPAEGAIVVTLPPRGSRSAGLNLIRSHEAWVTERLAALPPPLPFADGITIPIGGEPCRIRHMPEARGGAWLLEAELHVAGAAEFLARRVADFLRAEARRRLSALVAEKAGRVGITPRRIMVKDTVSRWGSCAPDHTLAFCWRLVMAPGFVQDYVAAHEVAHLRHMNHSRQFWSLVTELTPSTDQAIPWLRREGPMLLRIG